LDSWKFKDEKTGMHMLDNDLDDYFSKKGEAVVVEPEKEATEPEAAT